MVGEINDPSPLRMPPASSSQTADARKIGIIGNAPELYCMGSGEDSVIDLLKHLADNGVTEFVCKKIDRPLTR